MQKHYNGAEITCWDNKRFGDRAPMHHDKARMLFIPDSIERINIDNDIFPGFEKVEIDPGNSRFYTDGRMVITRGEGELFYCPVCRGARIEILEDVRSICDDAFQGTQSADGCKGAPSY